MNKQKIEEAAHVELKENSHSPFSAFKAGADFVIREGHVFTEQDVIDWGAWLLFSQYGAKLTDENRKAIEERFSQYCIEKTGK